MRDVAERAGVSFKTVSRVVNGEAGVSERVTERVEDAIVALGYRRDERARRLRQDGERTGTIAFALVDVSNPFFSAVLRGIEEVARRHDYLVLSGSTDGVLARERQLVDAFVTRRVDGLIIVPSGPIDGTLHSELERGTPIVFVDLEPIDVQGDLVRSDHLGSAAKATEHLIAHGHARIAFFGDRADISSSRLRLEGYKRAMTSAGLDVEERHVVQGRHRSEQWRTIISEHLTATDPPTAMFTAQNFVTIGATQALHDLGLHNDIALVGFDEIELSDIVRPGVTVIPQYPLDLGRRAAEILFARVAGRRGPTSTMILSSAVVVRGSGEIRPSASSR